VRELGDAGSVVACHARAASRWGVIAYSLAAADLSHVVGGITGSACGGS
jgi:hypothetical protein